MATVLVVDDEKGILNIMEALLEDIGHEVLTATNGEEALHILEHEQPELIISDIMMPIMDGLTFVKQVRKRPEWQTIKVILISAVSIKDDGVGPIDGYISKPFDIDDFERVVQDLLQQSP